MRSEKVLFKFGQKNKNIKLLRRYLINDDKSMLIEINEQNYIQNFYHICHANQVFKIRKILFEHYL